MTTRQDDQKLIEGCLNNDRRSQKRLYDEYAPIMLGICMRYANSKDEAEDILIEGFTLVFMKLGSFKGECSLAFWIKRVMINTAISNYRKNAKHYTAISFDEFPETQIEDRGSSIETALSQKELMRLIQEMPEILRIVLNLRAFEAYEYHEIAAQLEINEVTARTRFFKARKWLEERMDSKTKKRKK